MSVAGNTRIAYSQNFLRSPRLADRLLDRSGISADDLVIEIGPGQGTITERLATRCRQVLAIEKDPALVQALRVRFADSANVTLFDADFLTFPLPVTSYKVFANIPFNITAAIVGKLTSGASPPADAYLAVQREAAARFLGEPRETLVAILLKPWFEPTLVYSFRPADFAPAPAVDVVLLRLRRRETPLIANDDAALFCDLVAYAFSAWRPTVGESLARVLSKRHLAALERASGVSLARPPSDVRFVDWVTLTRAFCETASQKTTAIHGARERLERQQAGLQKDHRTRARRSRGRS